MQRRAEPPAAFTKWMSAHETGYVRHFLPWWWEEAYIEDADDSPAIQLTDEERTLMSARELSIGQILFRRRMRANFRNLAPQEYAEDAESCFIASGECIFDVDQIEKRLKECAGTHESSIGTTPRLLRMIPPMPDRKYIVAVDSAGGGSEGDYACAQIIDLSTGMQCAELQAHFNPQELAREVVKLAVEYNGALVAVERNNHGLTVLAYLSTTEKYANIYGKGAQEGLLTTRATRPHMIACVAAVLHEKPELFNSPRLLRELRTFVRHADGRDAAANGAHDDCVMAMGVALVVREEMSAGKTGQVEWASLGTVGTTTH
jgi:hypothetical protein